MRTIIEYLSGQFDEELRVLVAEARGWTTAENQGAAGGFIPKHAGNSYYDEIGGTHEHAILNACPPFSTSLDACRELLADLTETEERKFDNQLVAYCGFTWKATARQISVAYLIVKQVLK